MRAVYVASDASSDEDVEFRTLLDSGLAIYRYAESGRNSNALSYGGRGAEAGQRGVTAGFSETQVAVIEQWICTQAAVFLGTPQSTFTSRIQEER